MAITKIGTPELFDFSATNTALQLPTGDTASRPSAPSAGEWRFNSELKYVEYWDGGSPGEWRQIDTEAPPNPDDFPSQNFNVNTYFGNGGTQTIDAKFNEAANFNGSSSIINLGDHNVFSPSVNALSVSCWIKTTSTIDFIFSKGGSGAYEYGLFVNGSGQIGLQAYTLSASSSVSINTSSAYNDGNWHNIVGVYDPSGNFKIYVDGSQQATSSSSLSMGNSSNALIFGKKYDTSSDFYNGSLDQIRIFNTVLTPAQANDLYTDETTTTAATLDFPVGAGCIAAYQLDGDASDVGGTYGGVETNIGYTGLQFQPDMVWVKLRSSSSSSSPHALFDSIRGVNKILQPNDSAQEVDLSPNGVSSFSSNGFSVTDVSGGNNAVNGAPGGTFSGDANYVAWCWKAGGTPTATNSAGAGNVPTAGSAKIDGANSTTALIGTIAATRLSANTETGFSIVSYEGNGLQNATVDSGLQTQSNLVIIKNLDQGDAWFVGSTVLSTNNFLELNEATGVATNSDLNYTINTKTIQFTSASPHDMFNENGENYVMYSFQNKNGYQRISTYTGTGNNPGPIVYTTNDGTATGTGGFEPAFLLVKRTDGVADWFIYDNKRMYGSEAPANPLTGELRPNRDLAEDNYPGFNFYTNGFEVANAGTNMNDSGGTYLYLAIAADKDTSVPTQANSFSPTLYTGNGATQNIYTPFAPDFTWLKERSGTQWHSWYDSIRGVGNRIVSNSTNAQNNDPNRLTSFNPNGFSIGTDGDTNTVNDTYVSWNWKAGGLPTINNDGSTTSIVSVNQAAGFSIVRYKGNSASSATIGHGLSSAPEMYIVKSLSTGDWWTYHKGLNGGTNPANYFIRLNLTNGESLNTGSPPSIFAGTEPTSTVFSIGSALTSSNEFIAYCFADVSDYQKVGSYAGSGTSLNVINVGFAPRVVIFKCRDTAGTGWRIFDTTRGTDKSITINSDGAEYDDIQNYVDFTSTGFEFNRNYTQANGDINGSGRNYIYLAIA